MLSKKLLINSISFKMTSTEIALLLNNDSEKIIRIGEIIGKKIEKRDCFEKLNEFEKTFIFIDINTKKLVEIVLFSRAATQ